jgi:hypothetical protein
VPALWSHAALFDAILVFFNRNVLKNGSILIEQVIEYDVITCGDRSMYL